MPSLSGGSGKFLSKKEVEKPIEMRYKKREKKGGIKQRAYIPKIRVGPRKLGTKFEDVEDVEDFEDFETVTKVTKVTEKVEPLLKMPRLDVKEDVPMLNLQEIPYVPKGNYRKMLDNLVNVNKQRIETVYPDLDAESKTSLAIVMKNKFLYDLNYPLDIEQYL